MIRSASCRVLVGLWVAVVVAVGTVAVVFAGSTSRGLLQADERAAPALVLSRTARDLGTLSSRGLQQVRFEAKNRGRKRLVINRLGGGCRCDDAAPQTIVLPPGQSGKIAVMLDTRRAGGAVEEVFSFSTSDPARPRFDLTVRAQIEADAR
ncbi:hypothetical protein Mal4_45010 [Maioricimonas rarisocia]|uniref:DUF1573 domain-containing protein n=1 Tax=Maioricimonas rarisocia TaxID=2528026 RepID=A0A517ZCC1_9PLAN|nr:DUF1573 domain-containing protein [Maioricimonas rarisocia]QDU40146.1 hypothetical protein Mal4_45010 [Maioricimonas rarisocia]